MADARDAESHSVEFDNADELEVVNAEDKVVDDDDDDGGVWSHGPLQ
jgi:hypothetical protein